MQGLRDIQPAEDPGALLWPVAFVGYFGFQAVLRWLLGGSLGLDEAQIILEARSLQWGYGAQPPLYAWLQWAMFQLVGDPLLAMALLKNALLATTFLAIYALVRTAHPPRVAGVAAASLMLLPQIAWESQRALTHSVLATTLAAVCVLVFWVSVLGGRPRAHLLFGAVAGLGLLAKPNFAVVPLALVLAAASSAELRPRLRPAALALSLAVAAAIAAGPLAWALAHPDRALASLRKLDRATPERAAVEGLASLASASAGFLAMLAAVTAGLRWRFGRPCGPPAAALDRFLVRFLVVAMGLVAVTVLLTGTTNVKDRWLQPVLFLAAPAATLWLVGRATEAATRWLGRAAAAVAVLAVLALPVNLRTGTPGKPARSDAPIGRLAEEIATRFPAPGMIIADSEWLAGNLHYRRPGWIVEQAATAPPATGEALLVWTEEPARGAALAAAISERSGRELQLREPVSVSMPYPWQPDSRLVVFMAPLAPKPGAG